MTNKIKPADNSANIKNANKGSSGVNKQNAQVNGNRGKQLNSNQKKDQCCNHVLRYCVFHS